MIRQMAEEDTLPLDEIAHELACQYRFIDAFPPLKPTPILSFIIRTANAKFPDVARFSALKWIAVTYDRDALNEDAPSFWGRRHQGFLGEFHLLEETEALFTILYLQRRESVFLRDGVMCHPAFVDKYHYSPERLLLPPLN